MITLLAGLAVIAGGLFVLWLLGQITSFFLGEGQPDITWAILLGGMTAAPLLVLLGLAYAIGMSIVHP